MLGLKDPIGMAKGLATARDGARPATAGIAAVAQPFILQLQKGSRTCGRTKGERYSMLRWMKAASASC